MTSEGVRLALTPSERARIDPAPGDALDLVAQIGVRTYRMATAVRLVDAPPGDGFVVDHPTAAERAERREFYRLLTRLSPRLVSIIEDGETRELPDALILDVSGGGARLRSLQPVPVGARLELVFALDDDPIEVDIEAEVIRLVPPEEGRQHYQIHCKFIDVPRSVIERIVRFVFRRQAKQTRRRAS